MRVFIDPVQVREKNRYLFLFLLQNPQLSCQKYANCLLKLVHAEHHSLAGIMMFNRAAVLASLMVVVLATLTDSRVSSSVIVSVANIVMKVTVLVHLEFWL